MLLTDGNYSSGSYRFGFNGMEKDDELKGTGNSYDFGARIYDPRVVRWMSVDRYQTRYTPIAPYVFSLNNPVYFIDSDGNIVYGVDGEPVTIEKNSSGNWIIKGKPDKATQKFFKAMLKTPKGVEAVQGYVNPNSDEFRFIETSSSELGQAHGRIDPVDKDNNKLTSEYDKDFSAFLVLFTTDNVADDRMKTWSDEEKLNVIGTHEKEHERRGLLVHLNEIKPVVAELTSRFQYSIMYPEKSANMDRWINNYTEFLGGTRRVKNAYRKAIKGLVKSGDITRKEGREMKRAFKSKINKKEENE